MPNAVADRDQLGVGIMLIGPRMVVADVSHADHAGSQHEKFTSKKSIVRERLPFLLIAREAAPAGVRYLLRFSPSACSLRAVSGSPMCMES